MSFYIRGLNNLPHIILLHLIEYNETAYKDINFLGFATTEIGKATRSVYGRGGDCSFIQYDTSKFNPTSRIQLDSSSNANAVVMGVDYALENSKVDRYGIASNHTTGTVYSTSVTANIGAMVIAELFLMEASSGYNGPGDSGAPILNNSNNYAVGIILGGQNQWTYSMEAMTIQYGLNVGIVTGTSWNK